MKSLSSEKMNKLTLARRVRFLKNIKWFLFINLGEKQRFAIFSKMSKPLMERRRRERINHSLETLRLLMAEHTQNEVKPEPAAGFPQTRI